MISTALVPLDGSPSAEQAIPYAQALLPDGGEVKLFQVVPEPDPLLTPLLWVVEEGLSVAEKDVVPRELERAKERVVDRRLSWTTKVAYGDPADQILQAIARDAIDLIVMTTHGRGAIGRTMFGSVADRLARASPVPVLLVRPQPVEASSTVDIKRLLVPLDGSELAEGALPVAIELAKRLHVPIHLVRAIDLAYFLAPMSPMGVSAGVYDETVADVRSEIRSYLEGVVARLREQGVAADWTMLEGSPYVSVSAACAPGDLIVMTSHGRSGALRWFLGSVAEKLVREAPGPVLLVPSAGRAARLDTV